MKPDIHVCNEREIIEAEIFSSGRKLMEMSAVWFTGPEAIIGNLVGEERGGVEKYYWTVDRDKKGVIFRGRPMEYRSGQAGGKEGQALLNVRLSKEDWSIALFGIPDSRYVIFLDRERIFDLGGEGVSQSKFCVLHISELTLPDLVDILNELVKLVPQVDLVSR